MAKKKRLIWIIPICVIAVFISCFFIYTSRYYHADATALSALENDAAVTVTQTDYGWLFDGPSESDALIFYPGAKVEETAYAPLMHLLASENMDVLLVKMPFHLAIFGANRANDLIARHDYANWYIGGHSLGGAMAANFASKHPEHLTGLILLAAYPTGKIDDTVKVLTIYGSEDGVLNMKKMEEGRKYLPDHAEEYVIEGGNHAQFGNYGEQKGDGIASISHSEQQNLTKEFILQQNIPRKYPSLF